MKTAIIYYGYGIHTKMISEKIQDKIDCDIYRIKPVNDYSNDYQKVVDDTEDNLQSRKTPEIQDLKINLDSYDNIIIGTPVWWYTIAPPLRTFLKEYDLSNKRVFVYATNAGWLGSTFKEVKQLCESEIISQKSIKFTMDYSENKLVTSEDEIESWIDEILEKIKK